MKRLNQEGAVAIISVVIFITIITIVVSAYLVSAIAQQRTAVNFDMGTRAYYSAESGVQDAVRAVAVDPGKTQKTCIPLLGNSTGKLGATDSDYGLDYTCQLVDSVPTEISGQAKPNELTAMFRLSPANAPKSATPTLIIEWSPSTAAAVNPVAPGGATPEVLMPRADGSKTLPQITNWKNNSNQEYHAMLRLNVLSHPKSGALGANSVKQHVVFVNPAQNAEPTTPVITQSSADDLSSGASRIINAACKASTDPTPYSCKASINLSGYDFNNDAIYVRIGALYRATSFSVHLMDGSTSLAFANTQATIDVTGRAKDVYRRVKQTFPINGGYFEDKGPDAAVVAGEGICKLFSITTQASDFTSNCDPLHPTSN